MESLRAEWWYSFRLPVNWKLAEEAFLEQYHVIETHPQLVIPGRYPPRDPTTFDPRTFVESELHYLHTMSDGMAGMVHANDVAHRREACATSSCRPTRRWPWPPGSARSTTPSWRGTATGGVTSPTSTSSRRPG